MLSLFSGPQKAHPCAETRPSTYSQNSSSGLGRRPRDEPLKTKNSRITLATPPPSTDRPKIAGITLATSPPSTDRPKIAEITLANFCGDPSWVETWPGKRENCTISPYGRPCDTVTLPCECVISPAESYQWALSVKVGLRLTYFEAFPLHCKRVKLHVSRKTGLLSLVCEWWS